MNEFPNCEDPQVSRLFPTYEMGDCRTEFSLLINNCKIRKFYKDGYLILDEDLTEKLDLAKMEAHFSTFCHRGTIADAWTSSPEVKALATNPTIMSTLKSLYGRTAVPFKTVNYFKGSQQRTHSDSIHYASLPERFMCGVWIALEDISYEQGPLHYYPGSNRLPILSYKDLGIAARPAIIGDQTDSGLYSDYEKAMARIADRFERKELKIKKGSAFIWAANLLYGGSKILNPKMTGKCMTTHYYFEDTIPFSPMHSDMDEEIYHIRHPLNIATNEPMKTSLNGEPYKLESTGSGYRIVL